MADDSDLGAGAGIAGISLLVVPLNTPGIEVRPIHTIDQWHHVNEVFLNGARVPVVLCSGFSDHLQPKNLEEAGIREFVEKPFTVSGLLWVHFASTSAAGASSRCSPAAISDPAMIDW